ncbi:AraC family transcriptional regulator [Sporomusa sphaeroides]|uniref:AraC family transcriptional regulator n=1 Tax=Sporomusa sphaeroides TaxID=47679 RepID=UPI002030C81C|nr:AraC family transcriptional regulator [Sporomusa sphaeroides]MCM0757526.1 AraC family transcriptional regulator [Sporomusa sphaeroides DSM 2875]HML32991.1 AraC family transcriptional regulator [Sporomusa sphaeroides]
MNGVRFYRDADLPFFELKLCDASYLCYKKHSHEEYSLGIVEHGKSSFWCEGKVTEVSPKTTVLIPPGLIHSCNPDRQGRWQYKMFFIEAGWMQRFLTSKGIAVSNRPVVSDMTTLSAQRALHALLESLAQQASPLEKEAGVMALFEQVVGSMEPVGNCRKVIEVPKLKMIKDYLHNNYLKKITLEELETISGLNKFAIIRAFKEEFNIPPHTYQTLLRINYAKKLLRQNRQIVEVACEAGFYDQSHFHKVFKSHTGVTPEKYQRLK